MFDISLIYQFSLASDMHLSHLNKICGDILSNAPRKTKVTSFKQQLNSSYTLLFITIIIITIY